jgi:hypothetical protein
MGTLTFLDTDTKIEVPDDPAGEREAVAAHPEYQRALAANRNRRAAGEPGTPLAEVMAHYGVEPVDTPRRLSGRRAAGDSGNVRVRMPRKLHRELAEQAAREGVSLNTLIVTYLAREAGVRATATGQA